MGKIHIALISSELYIYIIVMNPILDGINVVNPIMYKSSPSQQHFHGWDKLTIPSHGRRLRH
jgi:hypothetical protein